MNNEEKRDQISLSCHVLKCDQTGEYDLAGFAVGAVKKDKLIDGKSIKAGDVVLALKSSGVHSNGFSLVRKVIEKAKVSLHDKAPWTDKTFGEVTSPYLCKKEYAVHVQILRGRQHK